MNVGECPIITIVLFELAIHSNNSESNPTVILCYSLGGYPDNPGPNPANPGGLSRRDCVVIDGFADALCFAFRNDNSGPPTSVEVIYFCV